MSWVRAYILRLLWCSNMNLEKVICPCLKVTKGDLVHAVEQGAASFKEVKQMTRVAKACGKCKKKAKKTYKKILKAKKVATP